MDSYITVYLYSLQTFMIFSLSNFTRFVCRQGIKTTIRTVRTWTTPKFIYFTSGGMHRTQDWSTRILNTCREFWYLFTVRYYCEWYFIFWTFYNILFLLCPIITAFAAFVFCICMTNVDGCEGPLHLLLTTVIGISIAFLLISLLMLCRLPQAVESLSFRVRKSIIYLLYITSFYGIVAFNI